MSSESIELPVADLELERMVSALPFAAPSRRLDARVAAAVHFAGRPRIHRMRWPAAVAALMALTTGLAMGWRMRDTVQGSWIPAGTEWQTAGISDLGPRRLADGQVVRCAETLYLRTDHFRDPANGAVIELRTLEPRLKIGRPSVD
jgi:hypothetical protein